MAIDLDSFMIHAPEVSYSGTYSSFNGGQRTVYYFKSMDTPINYLIMIVHVQHQGIEVGSAGGSIFIARQHPAADARY